jgi:alpha-L-fucosidase
VDFADGARRSEERAGLMTTVAYALAGEKEFNAVDFGEDLSRGQQIAEWTLEADVDGVWRKQVSGTTAGFRRMERFPAVKSSRVRLICRGRTRAPVLSAFALRYAAAVPDEKEADPFEQWRSPCKVTEREPGTLEVDFLRKVSVNAIQYVPVTGTVLGVPDRYEIQISDDGGNWTKIAAGEFGNLRANPVRQRHRLPITAVMRYARVKATRALEGAPTWKGSLFEFFTWKD